MNLYELVVGAARRFPERLAVSAADGTLTYAELDAAADAVAHRLRGLGVGRGDRVVVWAEKSTAGIVAMQAVMRLGAAYVPQVGSTPLNRVAVVARDCAARVVCTTADRFAEVRAEFGEEAGPGLLDLAEVPPAGEPRAEAVAEPVGPHDPAYILYTSGSTGKPKGVCISHLNARAFVDWAAGAIDAGPQDRFSNHAPLTFDLSVLDLYAAFAVGASVHLVPAELAYAPVQLVQFLHDERITVWYSVPSALTLMMRDGGLLDGPAPESLRAVLFAGEPFPIAQVRRLAEWTAATLMNLYGPTETNVCTAQLVRPEDLRRDRPVPIGAAVCGDKVWAAMPDGRVAGPGDEGELIVDGPTVMLGYWGQEPHHGPYPTGDVVRVLPDGAFDYVGRRDHMVKVRGHRIELGDVEAALGTHPDVDDCAALVVGSGIDARLTAFVVAKPGRRPGILGLKRHCSQRLPRYLVADEIRVVAALPRTRNGKVDRVALAEGMESA
ncbi:amino acid adenylation domain-containing protein [Dactylosporangium sp. NPDC051541]|uniref:amino acid adenylation domain-containing protein n=1 Tax=Dactylosporangium sp. NPDC051541 TaxID=3363977 RepID=UPI0037986514